MYTPNQFDLLQLRERAVQFQGQIDRFKQGNLDADRLRPLRLQNGLYIQRHAPMLRIAIAYGMLNSQQLRALAQVARQYDHSYGHFTTRQNLQLNWITLEDAPRALADLAQVGLHGIQSSGNCLRNITSDALAGIAPEEILDPRPFAELLRQWSTFHPEFTFLPRKFKVALTGTPEDRALIQVHDLAFEVVQAEPAKFRVRVGGGLGRTPILGPVIRESLDWQDLLTYTQAVMRVYNALGRRDNLAKARIKILVRAVGVDVFREMVEKEWQALKDGPHRLPQEELDRVKAAFIDPDWSASDHDFAPLPWNSDEQIHREYLQWIKFNRLPNRHAGFASVMIVLKATGRAPGDASSQEMESIAELADRYSQGFIRVTHTQNLVLPAVQEADLPNLFLSLRDLGLHRGATGLIGDMVACPGGDFCSLANARSLPLADDIALRFQSLDAQEDLGPIDLRISGCMNSCGHHHVGHIGILGVDKDGAAFYQILLGGHSGVGAPAALGTVITKAFAEDEIADAIEAVLDCYLEHRKPGELFRQAVARLGKEPFASAADQVRGVSTVNTAGGAIPVRKPA
jgi:sulfite reductase (NADPH) hemoprotein beta-component